MENSKSKKLIFTGLLLIAAALFLCAYNFFDADRAQKESLTVADTLVEKIREKETVEEEKPDYVAYPEKEMPTVLINGKRYIGYIEITDLGITLPVASECNLTQLKKSPCLYNGSVYLDNMVIAAHNYRSHFGKLKNLPMGSEVVFTDADGNVFRYTIEWVETIEETGKEEMISADDWQLTLFTCTYGGEKRYAFRCIEIE